MSGIEGTKACTPTASVVREDFNGIVTRLVDIRTRVQSVGSTLQDKVVELIGQRDSENIPQPLEDNPPFSDDFISRCDTQMRMIEGGLDDIEKLLRRL